MKKQELKIRWSKSEKDFIVSWPCSAESQGDAYNFTKLFNNDMLAKMEDYGYDLTALKFSIQVCKNVRKFDNAEDRDITFSEVNDKVGGNNV